MQNVFKLIAVKIGSDYGILADQLFQFDPQILVDIKQDEANIIINLKENPEYIRNFFGRTVQNICGIVGKNGVGKSTTLRFLKELFIKDTYNRDLDRNDIIIFLDNNTKINCYANQGLKNHIIINNLTEHEHIQVHYRQTPKLYDLLRDVTTVFYSNSIDEEKKEIETNNFYNISTGYLRENIGKINKNLQNKTLRNQGGYKRFKLTELIRQIKLLQSIQGIQVPFANLTAIKIDILDIRPIDYKQIKSLIKKIDSHRFSREKREEILNNFIKEVDNIEALFEYEKKIGSFKESIFEKVVENFIIYLLKTLLKNIDSDFILMSNNNAPLRFISRISGLKLDDQNIKEFILKAPAELSHELAKGADAFKEIKHIIEDVEEATKIVIRFFDLLYISKYSIKSLSINALSNDFLEFLETYTRAKSEFNFVSFRWPELSAGELSLLSFFSRIYAVSKDIKASNIFLLIDEGDLYFHPEWQRDYLFFLIHFLETTLENDVSVSILLTTHSPFILSDLPKENVILLKKDPSKIKSAIVGSDESNLETFGGNIHTLFTKAFFMGDTTVSKFARQKIQREIIDKMDEHYLYTDLHHIQSLINKIGEPVLKSSLLELFEKNYGTI